MRRAVWVVIPILWCGMIYCFTQSSIFTFASTGVNIADFLGIADWRFVNTMNYMIRKSAHLILFAMLAVFIKTMLRTVKNSYWMAWIGASAYGVTDEIHQVFIPGRSASVLDIGIDSAGAGVGLILYYMAARKLHHTSRILNSGSG